MTHADVIVIGGGAAGYFSAIRAASLGARTLIVEGTSKPLQKVKVSGGGRCNVTHACFEPKRLVENYPRGSKELLGPFHHFGPSHTVEWFQSRGVRLKTEADGRMFPETDSSETIIQCLDNERQNHGVELLLNQKVKRLLAKSGEGFTITTANGTTLQAPIVIVSTGGGTQSVELAKQLGHTIEELVPSLFAFVINHSSLAELSGVSVPQVTLTLVIDGREATVQSGGLLITHAGITGPAVLRASAWAARPLHDCGYRASVRINWLGRNQRENAYADLVKFRASHPKKSILSSSPYQLASRLWRLLVKEGLGIGDDETWANLSNSRIEKLATVLTEHTLHVSGKAPYKEEFVTCGGVRLSEVDFRTMQSRIVPGMYFSGEVLDIDAITGGLNFQAAWTTGWLAGTSAGKTAATRG